MKLNQNNSEIDSLKDMIIEEIRKFNANFNISRSNYNGSKFNILTFH